MLTFSAFFNAVMEGRLCFTLSELKPMRERVKE